jgi:hypothetical protein
VREHQLPIDPFRAIAATSLLAAAIAHVPVTPEHLKEAPYMGVAFIAFSVAATLLAVAVAATDRPLLYGATMGLCAAAIFVYAMTRMVAFPQLSDDVGNWSETLGVISVATEMIALVASGLAIVARQRPIFAGSLAGA